MIVIAVNALAMDFSWKFSKRRLSSEGLEV